MTTERRECNICVDKEDIMFSQCDNCNILFYFDLPVRTWNYCPNCGAKIIHNGVAEIS